MLNNLLFSAKQQHERYDVKVFVRTCKKDLIRNSQKTDV